MCACVAQMFSRGCACAQLYQCVVMGVSRVQELCGRQ